MTKKLTKKSRGAPLGNRNALKHGFYSAAFQAHERKLLLRLPPTDLSNEVDLLRIANYRLLEALTQSSAPLEVDLQLAILRAVTLSTHSMNALLRTQHLMSFVGKDSPELLSLGAPKPAGAAALVSEDSPLLDLPSGVIDRDDDLPPSP